MRYHIHWWTDERRKACEAVDEGRMSLDEWLAVYWKHNRSYDNFCEFYKEAKEMLRQAVGSDCAKRFATQLPLLEGETRKLIIDNIEFYSEEEE